MEDAAEFILWLLIGVGFITGVWNTLLPGEIFGKIGDWMHKNLPEWMNKPLGLCPICMPSIWGSAMYFTYVGMGWKLWPLYVVALSGVMKIVTILVLNHDEE